MRGSTVPTESAERTLASLLGRRLRRVRRIFFALGGEVDRSSGAIELTVDEVGPVVLDAAADGSSLKVAVGGWHDPFDRPLEIEDEEFVAAHGKWTGIDVSSEEPWTALIDHMIDAVEPPRTARGPGGEESARLGIDGRVIEVAVVADELHVRVFDE